MKTVAILDLVPATPLAFAPFAGGASAFERSLAALRALPDLDRVVVLSGALSPPPGDYELLRRDQWNARDLLAALSEIAGPPGPGAPTAAELPTLLVHAFGDQPFLDPALLASMAGDFKRWRAEYLFADGWPEGFAAEFLKPRILGALAALAAREDLPFGRDAIFQVLQKDINAFDVETVISRADLRPFRFRGICDSKRDMGACERLQALAGPGGLNAENVQDLLPAHAEILRNQPAFIHLQIVEACPQACSYCPYPVFAGDVLKKNGFMPVERYARLMDQVAEFCGDAVVDVSLWGDPSKHPDFAGIIEATLRHPGLELIVETSGVGWQPGLLEALAERYPERLSWVLSLDDGEGEGYAALRGQGYAEARAFAESAIRLFPRGAHVQAVRMRSNEARLEAFWRHWREQTPNVIIQKYDSFAGYLPDRAVADLSPIVRLPCWHLARDLVATMDGSVLMCREVLAPGARDEAQVLGNLFDEPLATVWARGEALHRAHVDRRYPAICERCDEYHTFNA